MTDSTATKVDLTFKKSTKGTHVYGSDDESSPITTLYIKRSGLPATPPVFITITIEVPTNV